MVAISSNIRTLAFLEFPSSNSPLFHISNFALISQNLLSLYLRQNNYSKIVFESLVCSRAAIKIKEH